MKLCKRELFLSQKHVKHARRAASSAVLLQKDGVHGFRVHAGSWTVARSWDVHLGAAPPSQSGGQDASALIAGSPQQIRQDHESIANSTPSQLKAGFSFPYECRASAQTIPQQGSLPLSCSGPPTRGCRKDQIAPNATVVAE